MADDGSVGPRQAAAALRRTGQRAATGRGDGNASMQAKKAAGTTATFCFGSNSVVQLMARVGNPSLTAERALAPGFRRVFAGASERWGGAVASIVGVEGSGEGCRGSIVRLTEEELEKLDRYEGIPPGVDPFSRLGHYRRQVIEVENEAGEAESAIAYLMNHPDYYGPPRAAYLAACARNIGAHWSDLDGAGTLEIWDARGNMHGEWTPPPAP